MLIDLLYDFFFNLYVGDGSTFYEDYLGSMHLTLFGKSLDFGDWLVIVSTIVSFIFIVVLCCLFVYKIIRLIGGLIR